MMSHTFCLFAKMAQWKKKLLPISLNLVLIIFGIMIFFHKILWSKRIITSKPSKNEFNLILFKVIDTIYQPETWVSERTLS